MSNNYLINNLEFSDNKQSMSGELPVEALPRLLGFLDTTSFAGSINTISYELFGRHVSGKPGLHLMIGANLPMLCQRCLTPIRMRFNLAFDYVLSASEPEELDADDDIDWLEISRAMDLRELIEDELIIALPIAPVHEHPCQSQPTTSGEKANPFAVLKGKF
jgi:uncharacterized protein